MNNINILNLLLIVLILTIEPFISLVFNNGLVFIKPENLTKTELVEKFKELSSSKSLKDLKNIKNEDKKDGEKITFKEYLKSHYFRLSAFIFKFKNLIAKIALFTILIKYFRKIRIMRFIFRIINYIFLSTLGIFISDIYGLKEIILQIEYYWMEYVNFIHENKIYKTLVKIFDVVTEEDKSEVIENKSEVIEDKIKKVENKSEIKLNDYEIPSSGRELKNEKIIHDKTSEWVEKENWLNKDLLILGLSIVSVGLIYIYWDSIIELFKNIKPDDGTTTTDSPIFLSHEEEYKKYFKEISTNEELYDLDVIRSQDKGKIIDYIDVENTKWEDSPTTPKASTSKLPETHGVMLPISRK
jgi:hypothetical protein